MRIQDQPLYLLWARHGISLWACNRQRPEYSHTEQTLSCEEAEISRGLRIIISTETSLLPHKTKLQDYY